MSSLPGLSRCHSYTFSASQQLGPQRSARASSPIARGVSPNRIASPIRRSASLWLRPQSATRDTASKCKLELKARSEICGAGMVTQPPAKSASVSLPVVVPPSARFAAFSFESSPQHGILDGGSRKPLGSRAPLGLQHCTTSSSISHQQMKINSGPSRSCSVRVSVESNRTMAQSSSPCRRSLNNNSVRSSPQRERPSDDALPKEPIGVPLLPIAYVSWEKNVTEAIHEASYAESSKAPPIGLTKRGEGRRGLPCLPYVDDEKTSDDMLNVGTQVPTHRFSDVTIAGSLETQVPTRRFSDASIAGSVRLLSGAFGSPVPLVGDMSPDSKSDETIDIESMHIPAIGDTKLPDDVSTSVDTMNVEGQVPAHRCMDDSIASSSGLLSNRSVHTPALVGYTHPDEGRIDCLGLKSVDDISTSVDMMNVEAQVPTHRCSDDSITSSPDLVSNMYVRTPAPTNFEIMNSNTKDAPENDAWASEVVALTEGNLAAFTSVSQHVQQRRQEQENSVDVDKTEDNACIRAGTITDNAIDPPSLPFAVVREHPQIVKHTTSQEVEGLSMLADTITQAGQHQQYLQPQEAQIPLPRWCETPAQDVEKSSNHSAHAVWSCWSFYIRDFGGFRGLPKLAESTCGRLSCCQATLWTHSLRRTLFR